MSHSPLAIDILCLSLNSQLKIEKAKLAALDVPSQDNLDLRKMSRAAIVEIETQLRKYTYNG